MQIHPSFMEQHLICIKLMNEHWLTTMEYRMYYWIWWHVIPEVQKIEITQLAFAEWLSCKTMLYAHSNQNNWRSVILSITSMMINGNYVFLLSRSFSIENHTFKVRMRGNHCFRLCDHFLFSDFMTQRYLSCIRNLQQEQTINQTKHPWPYIKIQQCQWLQSAWPMCAIFFIRLFYSILVVLSIPPSITQYFIIVIFSHCSFVIYEVFVPALLLLFLLWFDNAWYLLL